MKRILCSLLTAALLAPAVFAASFEGKVTLQMSSGRDKPLTMVQNIKGDRIRIEMPDAKAKGMGGMITDMTKMETIMLMDEQKMYMVISFKDAMDAVQSDVKSSEQVTLERTGEKEKILGYTAEKYISTYEDTKSELWLAEGLGSYMSANQGGGMGRKRGTNEMQAWERALRGKDLFPLRVVGLDKKGKQTFKMEVTAIEKQSLPDSLFAPPADYQRFEMPGVGGMMKGIMKGLRP